MQEKKTRTEAEMGDGALVMTYLDILKYAKHLWCDENGNLKKIDFSYRLIGLLVNFEETKHPYQIADQGKILFNYSR